MEILILIVKYSLCFIFITFAACLSIEIRQHEATLFDVIAQIAVGIPVSAIVATIIKGARGNL